MSVDKRTSFGKALDFTLQWEGGYSNHPEDPGGETMLGVTKRVYDAWRTSKGLPVRSVKEIEADELHSIYYNSYWIKAACHKMPEPLSTAVFDAAVNLGTGRAVRYLQRILCVNDDGIWGPKSQAALDAIEDIEGLCIDFNDMREDWYMKLVSARKGMAVFMKGWLRRLNALRKVCGQG